MLGPLFNNQGKNVIRSIKVSSFFPFFFAFSHFYHDALIFLQGEIKILFHTVSMGLTIHLCIVQCCFYMKVSEHLTCMNNHLNSYLVAYPQRMPGAGRREEHKLDSGKPEGGIEGTPRHGADQGCTPSSTGILWGSQALPGAPDLPGDTGQVHIYFA